jgi:electron transfer flavoprotein alpha subunit
MDIKEYKGNWVFAEQTDGKLSGVVFELLSKARELKKTNKEEVVAVLLVDKENGHGNELIQYGADKVILVQDPNLKEYKTISYASVLETLVNKYKPSILLFGATTTGKDLAPRLMAKLKTGLTADCLDLELDKNGILVQVKPSYGGNIMCKIICPNQRPQMATIRPGTFDPLEVKENTNGLIVEEIIPVKAELEYEILENIQNESDGVHIEEAEIIVAAGRGIDSKEDMVMIQELADTLGGVLGVSRPLVDMEWYDAYIQIGASGKTVKPKLIINVGVSGAIQYTVGMQGSKYIVSINKSKNEPIFDISNLGIEGCYRDIVPALIKELKAVF